MRFFPRNFNFTVNARFDYTIINTIDSSDNLTIPQTVYFEMGEYSNSRKDAKRMKRLDPRDHMGWYKTALCYIKEGKLQFARRNLLVAYKFNPEDEDIEHQIEVCNGLYAKKCVRIGEEKRVENQRRAIEEKEKGKEQMDDDATLKE